MWRESWQRASFGNFEANQRFLEQTGLLARRLCVLDVGCGKGLIARQLRNQGHEVVGIDRDPRMLGVWDRSFACCLASGDQLPFAGGSFDLVMSFDVFEHIPDSNLHLREVARVLRRPGHYALQTPNKWTNAPFEMFIWARKFGWRYALDAFRPPGHCALHNYWQLRRRLERNGYAARFHDVPVVNEFFMDKLRRRAGSLGLALLNIYNPDRMPSICVPTST